MSNLKINKKLKFILLISIGLLISITTSVLIGNYQTAEAAWSPVKTINNDTSITSLVNQTGNFSTDTNLYEQYLYTSEGNKLTARTMYWNSSAGEYDFLEDVIFTGNSNDNYKFNHFAYYMYSYDGPEHSDWGYCHNSYVTDTTKQSMGNNNGSGHVNSYLRDNSDLIAAFADAINAPSTNLGSFDANKDYIYMYDEIQKGGRTNSDYYADVNTYVTLTQNTDGSYTIKFINDTYPATENGTAIFNFTPNTHAKIDGFYLYDLNGNLLETLVINNSEQSKGLELSQETPMILAPFGTLQGINVSGNVIDAETKTNLENVDVTITYDDAVKTAKTDENGNFSLAEQIVPTSDITFTFTKDGYEDLTKTVTAQEAWYGGAVYVEAQMVPIVTPTPDPTPVTPVSDSTSNLSNASGSTKTGDTTTQLICVMELIVALGALGYIAARNRIKKNN